MADRVDYRSWRPGGRLDPGDSGRGSRGANETPAGFDRCVVAHPAVPDQRQAANAPARSPSTSATCRWVGALLDPLGLKRRKAPGKTLEQYVTEKYRNDPEGDCE